MTTTREARLAAEAWLRDEVPHYPELIGAVLAGSTSRRDPSEPHPPSSDVDLFLFVDSEVPSDRHHPRGRYAPRKILFRGIVLEPSFHPTRRLSDPAAVLGDCYLAPIFADPCILADPQGVLRALAAAVKPEYRWRSHALRRLSHALEMAVPVDPVAAIPADIPALRAPCWPVVAHAFGVMRLAFTVLVAGLRFPTIRRSFAVAREVLRDAGREHVAGELLRLLGSFRLSRTVVRTLADEASHGYDLAVATHRTPVVLDWNVSPDARELERAAVQQLIDEGHHREAVFQLLLVRTIAQGILENDADVATRTCARLGYQRLLHALGIDDHAKLRARTADIQAFMPTLRETCETILARHILHSG
ncbi:hypothetical protein ASA1KI_12350 [Opitutales bacterium ASA1]|uniref:hypothetical protein n=1 Tax=Congregicoccus parvus TaxID=3081749 RepID=UPI002B2F2D3F|nr:hypothetical protein ASA1KI_12350 [Opitutales bacterium ASA1]